MKNSIKQKIKSTGVLASAFLASAPVASGSVVHTDIQPDDMINQPNTPVFVDLDGNGVDDFKVIMREDITSVYDSHGSTYHKDKYIKIVGLANGNAVAGVPNSPRWNAEVTAQGNAIKNGNQNFVTEAQVAHMYQYTSWIGSYANCEFGDFSTNNNAMVAMRFKIGTNFHYGWVRLSVSSCASYLDYNNMEMTIEDFAYETVPNGVCYAGWKQYFIGTEVTSVTHNSARIEFLPLPDIDHFKLKYRKAGQAAWLSANVPGGTPWRKKISGLANNSDYEYKARGYYDAAETQGTGWSQIKTFATGCYTPDTVWSEVRSSTHAIMRWNIVDGAVDGYQIKARKLGNSGWVTHTVAPGQSSKEFYSLQPGVTYEWKVRSICKAQFFILSDFSPLQSFTMHSGSRLAKPNMEDPLDGREEFSLSVDVSPNPASNYVRVRLQNHVEPILKLMSYSGQEMIVDKVYDGSEYSLDVSKLANGFYMIVVQSGKSIETKKLIISK